MKTRQTNLLDFVGVSATGSGKSTCWLLPAAVDAVAVLEGDGPFNRLHPLRLVVVPLASQGPGLQAEADEFLWRACFAARQKRSERERPETVLPPRAVFVDRKGDLGPKAKGGPAASGAAAAAAGPTCNHGHPLRLANRREGEDQRKATCDQCQRDIVSWDKRASCRRPNGRGGLLCDFDLCETCFEQLSAPPATVHAVVPPGAPPLRLPCNHNSCAACRNPSSAGKYRHGCAWTCKICWPRPRPGVVDERWCSICKNKGKWQDCKKRRAIEATMLPPATEAEAEADTPPTLRRGQDGDEPDLQRLPDEASFAYDYATCLGFVTASALSDASHGGPLLRRVIAKRGVSALYVDEAHGVSADSMAYYNDALRDLHVTILCGSDRAARIAWVATPAHLRLHLHTHTPDGARRQRGARHGGGCSHRAVQHRSPRAALSPLAAPPRPQ